MSKPARDFSNKYMLSFCNSYNELKRCIQFNNGPNQHERKDRYIAAEYQEEYTQILTKLKKLVISAFFNDGKKQQEQYRKFNLLTGATIQLKSRFNKDSTISPTSISFKDNLGELLIHFDKDGLYLLETMKRLKFSEQLIDRKLDEHLANIDEYFFIITK